VIFHDQFGRPAIAVYRNCVNKPQQESLFSTSAIIKENVTPSTKRTETIHIGWWCRYVKKNRLFRSSETAKIRQLLDAGLQPRYTLFWQVKKNRAVFDLVDKYFKATDKQLYNAYESVVTPAPRLICKSYLMCALNFHQSPPHYDCKVRVAEFKALLLTNYTTG
jgi:hypothetical protein